MGINNTNETPHHNGVPQIIIAAANRCGEDYQAALQIALDQVAPGRSQVGWNTWAGITVIPPPDTSPWDRSTHTLLWSTLETQPDILQVDTPSAGVSNA